MGVQLLSRLRGAMHLEKDNDSPHCVGMLIELPPLFICAENDPIGLPTTPATACQGVTTSVTSPCLAPLFADMAGEAPAVVVGRLNA